MSHQPHASVALPGGPPIAAAGASFEVHEWGGGGPPYAHVHYADDEAWHVLAGELTFEVGGQTIVAPAGATVFVPAGVPHRYDETRGPSRYLIVLTPRLRALIAALHAAPPAEHAAIMRRFDSAIVDRS